MELNVVFNYEASAVVSWQAAAPLKRRPYMYCVERRTPNAERRTPNAERRRLSRARD